MAAIAFGVDGRNTITDGGVDAHVMTIAPTGAGKNVSSIIPNLLEYPGSVFVIDPKGQNVKATLKQRQRLGQKVHVLDPFGVTGAAASQFNPLDFIDLGVDGITAADRLADTLILSERGEGRHFSDEARALLKALILHVRTDAAYTGSANLGEVNAIASDPDKVLDEMASNEAYFGLVKRLAKRIKAKPDREGGGVWSTLQANLGQFLDDPRVAVSLLRSSFDFRDLLSEKTSVFIVLPAPYLETFNRWLRLLVGTALDRMLIRIDEANRPEHHVLMVLDEFAHLGALEAVQTAYGLARGAGVKIWAVLQSLSQLDHIYGEHGRENLIANSGSIEVFGMHDSHGCQYFSKKIDEEYVLVHSVSRNRSFLGNAGSANEHEELRARMRPIEIATLPEDTKLVFRRGLDYCKVKKIIYHQHSYLKNLAG